MASSPNHRRPFILAAAALGGLAACSPDPQGGADDAPIAAVETDPWTILNNVDGFANIDTRCLGTTGIYVTRSADDSSDTMQILAGDPACAGGATGTSLPR